MSDVLMPRLSDSMEEGTIVRWLKTDGESVERGEAIAEIETDKATMLYEADAAGTLEIIAAEGSTLAIGGVIARIGDGSPDTSAAALSAPSATAAADGGGTGPSTVLACDREGGEAGRNRPSGGRKRDRVMASPVAQRAARELGVDLATVRGTGRGGRIVRADVETAAATPPTEPTARADATTPAVAGPATAPAPTPTDAPAEPATGSRGAVCVESLSRVQETIARRMANTKATVPEFTVSTDVDMLAAVQARAQLKEVGDGAIVPSINDLVVKSAALALREHPRANGAYKDGALQLYERVNVGVAVAAQDALIVPTVFDADSKGLRRIAEETAHLAARVRDGQVTPPELSGGSFTVSNLGMFGIANFTAIIHSGQSGILAVGAVREEAVVRDAAITVGLRMTLTLTCDHRVLYGVDAARFLARVRTLLEAPLMLAC